MSQPLRTTGAVDAADPPSAASELVAPADWRVIDFISDLHLAENTPRAFEAWSSFLRDTPADAVFILGDLFEAWPGDDARHGGFEARCADVLRDGGHRRFVAFMAGNRDFLVGADLLADAHVTLLDDPTVLSAFGRRTLLSHGDAWCLADVSYQRFRAQVRSRGWKAAVLAQTLPQRRALALRLRQQSEQHAGGRTPDGWADIDPALALRWLKANDADMLIHGHTHRPGSDTVAPGTVRHVLADWNLDGDHEQGRSAGVIDGDRAEVLRWQTTGITRLSPAAAAERC